MDKSGAVYEKIIDENMAEVGIVCKGSLLTGNLPYITKGVPAYQIILKKDAGIWKYYRKKDDFGSVPAIVEAIKSNPNDASLYYFYGFQTMSENPAKAHRFFKKYYEMEPKGFWVTEDFIKKLHEYENKNDFENHILNEVLPDSPPGNHSDVFLILGQYFLEQKDFAKANLYFQKTEAAIKEYPSPIGDERLKKAKEELQLRMEGKYHDILDEIEKAKK